MWRLRISASTSRFKMPTFIIGLRGLLCQITVRILLRVYVKGPLCLLLPQRRSKIEMSYGVRVA
jgi:hypothetical protein